MTGPKADAARIAALESRVLSLSAQLDSLTIRIAGHENQMRDLTVETQTIVMEPAKPNATGSLVRFRMLKPGETPPEGAIVIGG